MKESPVSKMIVTTVSKTKGTTYSDDMFRDTVAYAFSSFVWGSLRIEIIPHIWSIFKSIVSNHSPPSQEYELRVQARFLLLIYIYSTGLDSRNLPFCIITR